MADTEHYGSLGALAPAWDEGERNIDTDEIYERFFGWVADVKGVEPWPHQEEAIMDLLAGDHVILNTPTGSGKSLVALGMHFAALCTGRRSYYTAPIKALVSEKFFALCSQFGADNVGMITGDAAVNADAPIICCTAEILANIALREGTAADIGLVIMDEFHFYSEPDRGWAWQVPILELPQAQFVLMSATLGDVTMFRDDLTHRTGRTTAVIGGTERPVPLEFSYAVAPLHETIEELLAQDRAPVYVVHFTQAAALERAQSLMAAKITTRAERDAIAERIGGFRFGAGFGRILSRLVRHGIGVHHAGLLPKYRRLVEQLAQDGLLKVICGTDTLGVGINVPIRTVLLTGLSKFDGTKQRLLTAREFHQVVGRAGRAGFDARGWVVAQAPEHVIDNLRSVAKAGDDPKKRRKVQRKKAPDGFVGWSEETFEKLIVAEPESLRPRLRMSHAVLINLLAREGNPVAHAARLIRESHHDEKDQRRLGRHALVLAKELLSSGVVERLPAPDPSGRRHALTIDLQRDFALNQPLAPFALAVMDTLDPESETYARDIVSVIEAVLEDPRQVLWAQESRARGEAVAAMKLDGVEYEERMDRLEEVTWPRPLADLLEVTLAAYRSTHPWLPPDALSPKSVVREMYERGMTFNEFVSAYGLARSEGLLLRYLTDAYRTLRHTVPESLRTEELEDLLEWLGELVRQTDSSLLDEWEDLVNPAGAGPMVEDLGPPVRPLTANVRAFTVMIRNAMFHRVELAARDRWEALGELEARVAELTDPPGEVLMDAEAWNEALGEYYDIHDSIVIDQEARSPALLQITRSPDLWLLRQVVLDPQGDKDWGITAEVDLAASDEVGAAVITVTGFEPLGG